MYDRVQWSSYTSTITIFTEKDEAKLSRFLDIWDSIQTLHVETTLESERDEQRSREIDANDVMDVSFLSVAIPHCDIIVTERFWVDLAKRNRLDQAYGTNLLTDLAGLEQHLPIYE